MKWTLPAVALLLASAWVVEPLAQNTNRKARTRRPSNAIGAGGAGTYARRPGTPTAAPTPRTPNNNANYLGSGTEGTGIRRRGNQNAPRPTNPTNANVNTNSPFIGGSDDGTGIRRKAPRRRRRP
jgi:hypothetical protein